MPVFCGHLFQEPQSVPATSQACHAPRLSRSPNSLNPPQGVLGRTSSYPPPLSYQIAPGGNGQPLVLTLAELPGQNPGEPLHLFQMLDPSRNGCIQSKVQGSPPAAPGGASCSVPKISVCSDPGSWSGYGPLTSPR